MARQQPTAVSTVRRRPKDRKIQIARVAAEAFSALGYHAVSVDMIAGRVGISAPALYRHYTSKYDLFSGAVLALSQELLDATDLTDVDNTTEPTDLLDHIVRTVIDTTLRNRKSGGLYRWQTRYLQGRDVSTLTDQLRMANRRIQEPLSVLRPELSRPQLWLLSSGMLSVIGSIIDHRIQASDTEIQALLGEAVWSLLTAELPSPDQTTERPPAWRIFSADAGVYEALLHASMRLFHQNGYAETSMVQIAAAAGLPVSGIYRYFPSKADILATALRRAADRLSAELSRVQGDRLAPRESLTNLVDAYVATSFANPELASVYYSEVVNLTPGDQVLLRSVQRSTIDSWTQLLTAARPSAAATTARFVVHAAMGLVVDLGRLLHYDKLADDQADSSYPQACIRTLMGAVLFGQGR